MDNTGRYTLMRLGSYYPSLPKNFRVKLMEQIDHSIRTKRPVPQRILEAHYCLSQQERDFSVLPLSTSEGLNIMSTIRDHFAYNSTQKNKVKTELGWLQSSPIKLHIQKLENELSKHSRGGIIDPKLFNFTTTGGYNCFHAAVYKDKRELIAKLKLAGGDVCKTADGGWSPLHEAVLLGRLKCAEKLLECGAKVQQMSDRGGTPLTLSVLSLSKSKEMLRLLLSNGADPWLSYDTSFRLTVTHIMAAMWPEGLEILLEHDPGLVRAQTSTKETPLHDAALGANLETVRALLKNGADVNANDVDYSTPLHHCWCMIGTVKARIKSSEVRKWVMEIPDREKLDALRQIKELLLCSGANVNSLNRYGCKPSTWAYFTALSVSLSLSGNLKPLKYLLGSGRLSWEGAFSNTQAWKAKRFLRQ